ncbi:hypothetical protein HYDPIDRAFT_41077 [Hydnomerulius pinastri MD-312]|uniref:BPL/LPL catalytic domain-containing protein n=1 Tax=Hydnomerulius pinastri MD-312 TaxID=994086 RepID=A0A0C9VZ73_9AGAM|nr:hypothetical protein HYDPIDRAFT_41077 [Hydnomerulius pinastri MD-312]
MNVLVYPSTHPLATLVSQSLTSLLTPHYSVQIISPAILAAPEHPWYTACGLLVLLSTPEDHAGVRKYVELGGRILAIGVNAKKAQGLFGIHESTASFGSVGVGLGLAKDTSTLRIVDGNTSLYVSFPSQASASATVTRDTNQIAVSRISSATLDIETEETRILGRYTDDNSIAGVLSQSGHVALWSCAPPLNEQLLTLTLSALGLRFGSPGTEERGPAFRILPQLLLAHPAKLEIQQRVVRSLFPELDLQTAFSALSVEDTEKNVVERMCFPDENDAFRFHVVHKIPNDEQLPSVHPVFNIISTEASSNEEKVKDIILPARPLTPEQERRYTPLFSPSVFFVALDEFRELGEDVQNSDHGSWRMGDALFYGEVVTSTQTMLDKNPKFLRALPSPILSFASKQVAGRGRGANQWLSPAGCMQMSLKLSVALKSPCSSHNNPPARHSIRPSNLVFIQYLYAIAVVEACRALDPAGRWAGKVKLKWPNDVYGEFPVEEGWKKVELKKLGGILVNTSFGGGVADVIIGCGLNVLNEPPIGSLAQLESLANDNKGPSNLTVERVAAAVLTTFERIWDAFLANEDQGFQPFMNRYTDCWLHSDQIVTLTTTTPHTNVRIVSITTDHGLLRTVPLSGGQYIDLQPDGNSFDMMKGLIRAKTT